MATLDQSTTPVVVDDELSLYDASDISVSPSHPHTKQFFYENALRTDNPVVFFVLQT
jgi:hypothetical protein